MVKALVMTGFGLNCDLETSHALQVAGAEVERVHLNSLIGGEKSLGAYRIFVVGGGFSWGDDHGAGVIMAMRLKHRLQDQISAFVESGGIVIGICNGFQVLVNLGILPGFQAGVLNREVALIANDCGGFRDQWVTLAVNSASHCVLSSGIETIELPIRHGEGKFFAEPAVIEKLNSGGQVFLRYARPEGSLAAGEFPHNPNGSVEDIAGICDHSGRVAGLMPHPEAFNHFTNHPDWTFLREKYRREHKPIPEEGEGIKLFRNAVNYFC
ncbi:MAG: phosphoribosylformylglycinamidine synthase subunit PurQ [Syntrophobacteraceae bacterium]|nr:phosphoribosylformylglycinamidine synthase subunit PurQ [Syntrophobacteraceae bacterium]